MKIHALLIVAHSFPKQLEDLVNLLMAPNHYFFIHIDKKSTEMESSSSIKHLKQNPQVVFLTPSLKVSHGGFSQILVTIKLLEAAFNHVVKADYFHLISGQDYPCRTRADWETFFENNEKSYMHFDSPTDVLNWRQQKYPERTDYFHFADLQIPFLPDKLLKFTIKGLNKMAKMYKRKPISDIYAGWSWFSWHRKVVVYVLQFLQEHPNYLNRFRNTYCCDELIFHTLLYPVADALHIEKYNSLRYVEWHPKRKAETLPLVLDEQEYEDIIRSCALFCRKIHPIVSANLIEMLKKDKK
ncbi:MAG: hypothetical protein EZS26_000181 [Candidatus Ordinivivax streblomastigis]|uniref:Peptide O-xylosyltransferase n=1 Tax=Candidatus Ordinivivax streblomastigis TaxID=2540710 RepID=A0A5M8P5Y3_9BACT|nr:MAG: hypothetical protein EZS26_000181 [Candidatus Ordinivivax streblomastigis]